MSHCTNNSTKTGRKLLFFYGFRRRVRHFLDSILAPFRPSGPLCFPVGRKSSSSNRSSRRVLCLIVQPVVIVENYCFSRVPEGTLGRFWARFWRCSVLQGHCVSLSGRVHFELQEEEQQQQQEQQEGSVSHCANSGIALSPGSAAGAAALKSGRRPRARVLAGGLRW